MSFDGRHKPGRSGPAQAPASGEALGNLRQPFALPPGYWQHYGITPPAAAGLAVQRKADDAAPAAQAQAPGAGHALIAPDGAPAEGGALPRGVFLARLRQAVTDAASDALGPLWSAAGCPYIDKWFTAHQDMDAAQLERLARRYAGRDVVRAEDYLPPICARVQAAVTRWRSGDDVSADLAEVGMDSASVPAAAPAGAAAAPAGAAAAPADASAPPVQRKRADASADDPASAEPAQVLQRLGPGRPLDADSAARMEGAFGDSFSEVRVHTDGTAAQTARSLGARAFTVGTHVAFADGQFQPGSTTGDALLAHELAHVQQQRGGAAQALQGKSTASPASESLEEDADQAAVGVLQRLYGGGQRLLRGAVQRASAGLRSDYGLQRCDDKKAKGTVYTGAHDAPGGAVKHYSGAQVDTFLSSSAAVGTHLKKRIQGGQVLAGHIHFYKPADFTEAWVKYATVRTNVATGKVYTDAEARASVPRAFTEEPEIHINEEDGEPRTAVHEGIHLYEDAALVRKIGFWAREGVCEYFAQVVIGEQGASATAGQNPALAQPWASAKKLAAAAGQDTLGKAFFSGDVAGLEAAVDKAKGAGTFAKWVGYMNKSSPDYAAADALL